MYENSIKNEEYDSKAFFKYLNELFDLVIFEQKEENNYEKNSLNIILNEL